MNITYAIRLQNDAFGDINEQKELLSLIAGSRYDIHEENNGYSGIHTHILLTTNKFQNTVYPNGELKTFCCDLLSKWLLNHRNKQHKSERKRRILKVELCKDIIAYRKYINKQNLYCVDDLGCEFDTKPIEAC